MGHAIVIKVDGEIVLHKLNAIPTLETLNEWVGGYLETVPFADLECLKFLAPGIALPIEDDEYVVGFCNEEGKINQLPLNRVATNMWHVNKRRYREDVLVGDVVFIWGSRDFMAEL